MRFLIKFTTGIPAVLLIAVGMIVGWVATMFGGGFAIGATRALDRLNAAAERTKNRGQPSQHN